MKTLAMKSTSQNRFSPLVLDQSWLIAMIAGGAFLLAMIVTFFVSIFTEIQISAWEVVGTIAPWYMAGISGWVAYTMSAVFISHGKTRAFAFREWLTTAGSVVAIGSVAMALGYLVETLIYRIAGFPGTPGSENFFDSTWEIHLVLSQYLLIFGQASALGGFVGISLYVSEKFGWLGIPIALNLATLSGTWGFSDSGFMSVLDWLIPAFEFDSLWIQMSFMLIVLVAGVLVTQRIMSTLSLRNP